MEDDPSNSTAANHRRSLFPPENCPQVSDEAFNLFHAIDRELYTRLIQNLGRDPAASVQVMAFWIWLERETNDMNLIKRMLSLPPPLLNDVAEESEACLKCVENDAFHFREITLLPSLLSGGGGGGGGNHIVVNLRFLHENRIAVLRGVSKIINTVCSRAFSDILRRNWRGNASAYHQTAAEGGPAVHFLGGGGVREVGESSREAERRVIEGGGMAASPPIMRRMLFAPHHMNVPFVPLPPPHVLSPGAHGGPPSPGMVADAIGIPVQMLAAAAAAGGSFPAYDLGAQRQMLSNELGELLSRNLSINTPMNHQETTNAVNNGGGVVVGDDGEEDDVGPDDRTIFLTFSKGYPITEDEVREFFTRKFGDFIEDMIMQEVGEDEQVLYARMVARSTAVIDPIVGGNKAKYSINGKHVWARKYIKKSTSSPPRGDHNNTPSSSSGQEAAVATGSPSS